MTPAAALDAELVFLAVCPECKAPVWRGCPCPRCERRREQLREQARGEPREPARR